MFGLFRNLLFVGPETFRPGQRVRLIGGYPSDIAPTANVQMVHGTVQDIVEEGPAKGKIKVLWDGFPHERYMAQGEICSKVFA